MKSVARGDPAAYTFSAVGSTYFCVILGDYAGTDQTAPIEKHGIFQHGSGFESRGEVVQTSPRLGLTRWDVP